MTKDKIIVVPLILAGLMNSSNLFASTTEQQKLSQLRKDMRDKISTLLKTSRNRWPDLEIIVAETYRSQARQDSLYKKGRNTTAIKVSKHISGLAADIYFIKSGKISKYKDAPYIQLGRLAEKLGLTWGGRWKVPFDPGHFELRK